MKPFRARGGGLVARLDRAEAGIVGLLLDQLEQLLTADPDDVGDDPVVERLFPDGHRGDRRGSRHGLADTGDVLVVSSIAIVLLGIYTALNVFGFFK